jgi:hypothetical protein
MRTQSPPFQATGWKKLLAPACETGVIEMAAGYVCLRRLGRAGAGFVIDTGSDPGKVSSNPSSSALSKRCRSLSFALDLDFGCFDLAPRIISSPKATSRGERD